MCVLVDVFLNCFVNSCIVHLGNNRGHAPGHAVACVSLGCFCFCMNGGQMNMARWLCFYDCIFTRAVLDHSCHSTRWFRFLLVEQRDKIRGGLFVLTTVPCRHTNQTVNGTDAICDAAGCSSIADYIFYFDRIGFAATDVMLVFGFDTALDPFDASPSFVFCRHRSIGQGG